MESKSKLLVMISRISLEHLRVSQELFNDHLIWSLEQPREIDRTAAIVVVVVPFLPPLGRKADVQSSPYAVTLLTLLVRNSILRVVKVVSWHVQITLMTEHMCRDTYSRRPRSSQNRNPENTSKLEWSRICKIFIKINHSTSW